MAGSRTNFAGLSELFVELRRDMPIALHRQVETGIRDRIRHGLLPAGATLPSTRALAAELGLSRGVVVEAYQQLTAEGYLVSRSGGYTQVAADAAAGDPTASAGAPAEVDAAPWLGPDAAVLLGSGSTAELLRPGSEPPARPSAAVPIISRPLRIDFRYGRPDVAQFPRGAWLRSVRRVVTEVPHERLVYMDGRGAPELREALADYLNRVRGTFARPPNVVISNGFAQGIRLLLQVLAANGSRRLAVEDPSSDDDVRLVAPSYGIEIVGVPVGPDGIDVDAVERSGADAVLVTAAHQFPTGAVLPSASRKALVEWASRRGALIIEDDYDAEFRYDRDPIGAIQGLAPDHVAYAGTASKTLAPGLRLGWLVVPSRLVAPVAAVKLLDDRGSAVLEQLTFADFVAHGEFDRHLRRMRPRYRRKRDTLLTALEERLPDLEPTGISAGQHLVTWLPADLAEAAVVAAAAERGLGVYGLSPYWLADTGRGGLLFGYGNLSEPTIVEGVDLLADAIAAVRSR